MTETPEFVDEPIEDSFLDTVRFRRAIFNLCALILALEGGNLWAQNQIHDSLVLTGVAALSLYWSWDLK